MTLNGLAATGVLPDVAPAFALVAAYALAPRGLPEFALRAGLAIAPAATEEYREGVVEFAWWSALAALCSGLRDAQTAAALWMCAAGELGQLAARPRLTRDPRPADRTWAALGPALVGQWEPAPTFVVQAGAGALFALVRDRFLLADDAVHVPPRLGIRVELGVGLRIW
jgi:hypothetical protein